LPLPLFNRDEILGDPMPSGYLEFSIIMLPHLPVHFSQRICVDAEKAGKGMGVIEQDHQAGLLKRRD
jgi:hypothetical protein